MENRYLFDGEGLIIKPNKSHLCADLYKVLKNYNYTQPP